MITIKTVSARTAVKGSQQEVFNAVTEWELQNKWVLATKVRGIGSDSRCLGGKLEAFTGIGKLGFMDTMTITGWDSPNVCEVTHTGNVVKGSGLFEISTENGITYFAWTERTLIPFGILGKAGWLIVGPMTKLGLKYSLSRFSKMFLRHQQFV